MHKKTKFQLLNLMKEKQKINLFINHNFSLSAKKESRLQSWWQDKRRFECEDNQIFHLLTHHQYLKRMNFKKSLL